MIELFKNKYGKGLCALCDWKLDFRRTHVIIEIKAIPPFLLLFHMEHYKTFIEDLMNYIKSHDNYLVDNFMRLNKDEIKAEFKIAKEHGGEFEKLMKGDLREICTIKVYRDLIATLDKPFICNLQSRYVTIKECFNCDKL